MKLKKASAVLGLLSILLMLAHIVFGIFMYLTMYYNPVLTKVLSWPFFAAVCLHAVFGMLSVFLQEDGTRMDLYPKKNLRTILQRVSAALIFPLLVLHIKNHELMRECSQQGQKGLVLLLMLAEILFFAVIITHVAVSLTKAFITMGWLTREQTMKRIDRVVYVIGAVAFCVSVIVIVRGQTSMFLSGGG